MTDIWQTVTYLGFNEKYTRPAIDLIARVNQANPKFVIDLGCGPVIITFSPYFYYCI